MKNDLFSTLAFIDRIENSTPTPTKQSLSESADTMEALGGKRLAPGIHPSEIPAINRQSGRHGGFATLEPQEPAGQPRVTDIPAAQRKAAGKNFPATLDQVNSGLEEQAVEEDDVGESNKFIGNLMQARRDGQKEADLDGDGDMEKVRPGTVSEDQQLDECGMVDGSMSPMNGMEADDSGKINVSANFDSESGRKSLTVTAEGDQAEELAQILKLSGMMGGGQDHEHPGSIPVVGTMDAGGAEELAKMLRHSGIQESYVNEPDEKVESTEKILDQGDDLHRKKRSYHKAENGDNPSNVKESTIVESLEKKLWAEFMKEKSK